MKKLENFKITFAAVLLVSAFAAPAYPQSGEIVSGSDLLKARRESNRPEKPAYEDRLPREHADELLRLTPAQSLFCLRINRCDHTLNQLDRFLTGLSPLPTELAPLARTQMAKIFGSAGLKAIDANGSFAVFGVAATREQPTAAKPPEVFIAALIPVTDYKKLTSAIPNISEPDEKGVSRIAAANIPPLLIVRAGSWALVASANDYDRLAAMAKTGSDLNAAGLAGNLDPEQAKQAMQQPVWAYANIRLISETFAPMLSAKFDQIKAMMENIRAGGKPAPPAGIIDMYRRIFETLLRQTGSLSIAVNPRPNVLNITKTVAALPGTDMAELFVAQPDSDAPNKLLAYLEDGAVMNISSRITGKLNTTMVDFLTEIISPADSEKLKAFVRDAAEVFAGADAVCLRIEPAAKPPFAVKCVAEITDRVKYDRLIKQAQELLAAGGIADFYKSLGLKATLVLTQNTDTYRDVPIDAAVFQVKPADVNSPEQMIIAAVLGEGINYRWAVVDRLWLCAVGANAEPTIRTMIDQAKAGGPAYTSTEITNALKLIPDADKADFFATYNFLRLLNIIPALVPVPMPQMTLSTRSGVVFTGKFGSGTLTIDIALPKEHLTEIAGAVDKMRQHAEQVPPADEEVAEVPSAVPPTAPVVKASIRDVSFPRAYGKAHGVYKIPLSLRLPVPATAVSQARLEKALTASGASLLPDEQWDRTVHFPKLADDKTTVEFDIELREPNERNVVFDQISGALDYFIAENPKPLDLGVLDLKAAPAGETAAFSIDEITTEQGQTIIELNVRLPLGAVKSAKMFTEDGKELPASVTGKSWSGDMLTSVTITLRQAPPQRAKFVLEVFQTVRKHTVAFTFSGKGYKIGWAGTAPEEAPPETRTPPRKSPPPRPPSIRR